MQQDERELQDITHAHPFYIHPFILNIDQYHQLLVDKIFNVVVLTFFTLQAGYIG